MIEILISNIEINFGLQSSHNAKMQVVAFVLNISSKNLGKKL